jgi:hypothetical protein
LISAVVRKGRLRFGFIHIGDIEKPEEEKPRIYFSFDEFLDKSVIPRRGYIVDFTVSTDEKGRSFASAIALTEEGKVLAEEREAAIALKRSERLQAQADAPPAEKSAPPAPAATGAVKSAGEASEQKPRRERRPRERRTQEGKKLTLLVSCEGFEGEKPVVVDLSQSIGRLKTNATALFEAPNHFNVYCGDAFLTKAILHSLKENDLLHLAAPREDTRGAAVN